MQESRAVAEKPRDTVVKFDTYLAKFTAASRSPLYDSTDLVYRGIVIVRKLCVQNLKFVALPVPEIIGGTQKIWAVPGYAHAPF